MATSDSMTPEQSGPTAGHGRSGAPTPRYAADVPMYQRTHGNPRTAFRMRKWVVIISVLAVCFAALNVFLAQRRETLPDTMEGVLTIPVASANVVEGPVNYTQVPPAGGDHAELPQLCGFYRVPIEDEHAVATLATGAIWATYQPDLADEEVGDLLDTLQGEYDVLLSPYPGQAEPIVLTAWGRQLPMPTMDAEQVKMFMVLYTNHDDAPLKDESCSRGVGLPVP